MLNRVVAMFVAACFFGATLAPAQADNQLGYKLITAQEATALPRQGGVLGLNIAAVQKITDQGLTFEILGIKSVKQGSPGAQIGFQPSDEIIAVDGRVFENAAAFAGYLGSLAPGASANFDIIPAGAGPEKAQRIAVTLGAPGETAPAENEAKTAAPRGGLSTGAKVAIGVGAAALFGCYKLGCFKRKNAAYVPPRPGQQAQPQQRQQQQQQQQQQQLQQQQQPR